MASTTARTAEKRATWRSRITVSDLTSVSLRIDADPRFAAGAGGVARYFADMADLDSGPAAQLQSAVVVACQAAFEHVTPGHPLTVTFTRHADRIEVAISHDGASVPTIGLDKGTAGVGSTDGVDRIQYETKGSRALTLLTKYLTQGAPSR